MPVAQEANHGSVAAMSWFDSIAEFIAAYRYFAYALVFAMAFWESIPVVGLFIPGSTLIVGAAILVPTGALELGPVLVLAGLGALAGDVVAFWMGRRHGRALLGWGPLASRGALVERAERFFRKHGGKAILMGRMTPPLRGVLPAIGGMAGMEWRRFLAAAVIATLCWAPAHVLPGALIGASLQLAGEVTARLGVLILLVLVFGYLLLLAARVTLFWGIPAGAEALRRLLIWARAHDTIVGREIVALLDPGHREARALASLAILLILGGWGFFAILEDVIAGAALVRADASIFNALQSLRTPWGDMAMVAITELGDARVTLPVVIAGIGWLLWRRAWIDAAYLAAAVVVAQAVAGAIKIALHTPRPIPELYEGWSAFSFPSGHATVNAVVYGFLAVMTMRESGPVLRSTIAAACALLVGLIALSRLYLGAHWFTDVAGGAGHRHRLGRAAGHRLCASSTGRGAVAWLAAGGRRCVGSCRGRQHCPLSFARPGPLSARPAYSHHERGRMDQGRLGGTAVAPCRSGRRVRGTVCPAVGGFAGLSGENAGPGRLARKSVV